MRFSYCPRCGAKTELRTTGDDGLVPWCPVCETPLWDKFTTSVICAVVNARREVALLGQNYISDSTLVCVSGIVKPGEAAEDAARREIREELGLDVTQLSLVRTYPYAQKDMLMIGFLARTEQDTLVLSPEVDFARWVPLDAAPDCIRAGSIARQLVTACISLLS